MKLKGKMEWERYKDTNYEVSSTGLVRIICHTMIKSNGVTYNCVPLKINYTLLRIN